MEYSFPFIFQVGLQKELDQYQLKMLTQETHTTAVSKRIIIFFRFFRDHSLVHFRQLKLCRWRDIFTSKSMFMQASCVFIGKLASKFSFHIKISSLNSPETIYQKFNNPKGKVRIKKIILGIFLRKLILRSIK